MGGDGVSGQRRKLWEGLLLSLASEKAVSGCLYSGFVRMAGRVTVQDPIVALDKRGQ